ncbi:hypothetical protein TRFO_25146 [Tritrichomonas foetus]|uniref:Uncharacterized protein n=1 Tax=Tritrichomonas foetus TaxID=1144522 RepID=A0A1J4K689_9EUKA|nr:hypothetical protein TRFO_25146 [Tritrichomonas foetus]|eukprot:OHT06691.1 hypothetical protein TRFO_25146 [Tritrichomonas foetus]
MKKELQKNQESTKSQMNKLYDQIDSLQSAKDSLEIDYKTSFNTIQRIITTASHYFQYTFNKADDLIQFLEQPPQPLPNIILKNNNETQSAKPKSIVNVQQTNQKSDDHHKNRKLKQMIDENLRIRENLESEVVKLKKEIKDNNFTYTRTIEDLNKKILQSKEDSFLEVEQYKHQISVLEEKVQTLKADIQKRKDEIKKVKAEHEAHVQTAKETPKPAPTKKEDDLVIANEQMVQRTVELGNQVRALQDKLDASTEKVKELNEIVTQKDISIDQLNHDLSALKLVHQSTLEEIETVRNALHSKDASVREEERRTHQIHILKGQFITLQKTNESQLKQIRELSSQNEKNSRLVDDQTNLISKLKRDVEILETRNKEMKDELGITKQEMAERLSQIQPDVMPAAVWKFNEFDATLTAEIDRIALSPTLQPSTKLQHIYRTINKHFKEMLLNKDRAFDAANRENQAVKELFNQFFVDASIALAQKPISFDDFLIKNGHKNMTEAINRFRNDFDEMKRQIDINETIIKHLIDSMNFNDTRDPSLLITQINELKAQFVTLKSNLAHRKKRIASLKAQFQSFKNKSERDSVDIKELNEHLKNTITGLNKNNKDLISNAQVLKREIHKQKMQIDDLTRNYQDAEARLKAENDHILKEKETSEHHLNDQIEVILKQLREAEQLNMTNEIAITKMKKVMTNMKTVISEKEAKIQEITTENEANISHLNDKWTNERNQIVSSYESAIAEVKAHSEEQRNDVEKLVQDLSDAKKKKKKARNCANQLRSEKMQLEKDIEALKLQVQRAKKVAEAAAKSQLASAEAEFNSKIDEQRTNLENEKRKLFAFVADQFRQFFNPHDSLDENTFRCLVSKASSELIRLMSSDMAIRKMVGADVRQKTDDAVARIITDC